MKVVFVGLLCLGLAFGAPDHSDSFEEFKTKYGKTYDTPEEESLRKSVWEENVKHIQDHNLEFDNGVHTFNLGENAYADLSADEFKSMMNGLAINGSTSRRETRLNRVQVADLPANVDWRSKGYVTPVKDQKVCGSCWAFSATGSLEGAHFAKTGKLVSLSEQNLVDCSSKEGNLGCFGGLMDRAFEYVKVNGGIDTEASYPYTAKTGTCKFSASNVGATLKSWKDIPHGSEEELQKAVATVGPVSVGIDASRPTFHLYKSGIYQDPECSSMHLDHGVLAVGYGSDSFTLGDFEMIQTMDYWLVKNSWGDSWGDKGYVKMARNMKNACGIATAASYPLV